MSDIAKICKIHGELTIDQTRKDGKLLRCKQCRINNNRKHYDLNRDKRIAATIKWRKENIENYAEWQRQDRIKNPDKYKKYEANYIARHGRKRVRGMEVARIHGLTLDQYNDLLLQQKGICQLCNKPEKMKGRGGDIKPLSIDHCHESQANGIYKIRGLLCHHCNAGLGHFFDDVNVLKSAIAYLESHTHE